MSNSINILKPHLAINVRDVEASIAFYQKMFGVEPSKVRTGYAKFDVQRTRVQFYAESGAVQRPRSIVAPWHSGSDDR